MDSTDLSMDYIRWAERYDIFYEAAPEGELEFYLNSIERVGGSVLELGVGTGRIAIPAAMMGHDVTGVDLNCPMLDCLRRKIGNAPLAGTLELIEGDISEFQLPKKDFDLVLIPAHTLALVTDENRQIAALNRCAAHMATDAKLIFNLFNPSDDLINDDSGERFLLGVVVEEEQGIRHVLSGINDFDTETQTNQCVQTIETFDSDGQLIEHEELNVVFRYLHHHDVMDMLNEAGLELVEFFGDFDSSPFDDDSEEMIYVCRRIR